MAEQARPQSLPGVDVAPELFVVADAEADGADEGEVQ